MQVSIKGAQFIGAHEGNPLTAYLDPVGIPTIGHGFTMRSKTVKTELAKLGIKKLVPGKTRLTADQSDAIFEKVLNGPEYAGAVTRGLPKGKAVKQHMFDAMASAAYNLGPGFMGWKWKNLWVTKGVSAAADYWSRNYNKASGKRLPGLVRRRREEARLFERGVYAGVKVGTPRVIKSKASEKPDPVTKEAQEILTSLGFKPGPVDGWYGKQTRGAVLSYQKQHPHLVNDGVLGPATLAQLRRDAEAPKDATEKTLPGVIGTGIIGLLAGLPWSWIAGAVGVALIAGVGYFTWTKRDIVKRRWNNFRNKEATPVEMEV